MGYNITQKDDGSTAWTNAETSAEVLRYERDNNVESGTYGSPTQLQAASEELFSLHATPKGDGGGFTYCMFTSTKGQDSTDNLIGLHNTCHIPALTGSAPKTVQAIQGHMLLDDSTSKLATRGGDATAGGFGAWFKIGGVVGSEFESGSRVAAIWLDNQMSGTTNGEEYSIFSTTGGSVPDAWARLETSSSGWTNLFDFDDAAPVSDGGSGDITFSGTWKKIAIDVDGTTLYLIASASPS